MISQKKLSRWCNLVRSLIYFFIAEHFFKNFVGDVFYCCNKNTRILKKFDKDINLLLIFSRVFQLDPEGSVHDDYVEIYSPDLNGRRLGRWFAKDAPQSLTAKDGFWIKFRSNDDSSRGKGFRAEWALGISSIIL